MEIIIDLAFLALHFLLKALVITAVIFVVATVRGQKYLHFWSMFRVTCVILLVVNLILVPLLDGPSE